MENGSEKTRAVLPSATRLILVLCFATGLQAAPYLGEDDALNYLVLADWGGQSSAPYVTTCEMHVAKQMGVLADSYNSRFVLALGDNFYDSGVKSVFDPRFKETFEDVFTAESLQVPWYVVAGNHDWKGNVLAEIDYTEVSTRWEFPHFYYTKRYLIPGGKDTVAFIMIDTVLLCGITDDSDTQRQPSPPIDQQAVELQFNWIEDQLKDTINDTYVIVAGHYPVWSIAENGPTDLLVDILRPLLMKYNVSAYFCGHDHNLQHIRENGSSVEYFIIGAAHSVNPSLAHKDKVPVDWVKFHYADQTSLGGFAYIETTSSGMNLTFADGVSGKSLYHATIKPRIRDRSSYN